jgi:excisionase family DNA binding protein
MKSEQPIRRLLKAREAIQFLGISRRTFEALVHDGRLPVVQIGGGGKWLVDTRDLETFIGKCKTTCPAPQ